MREWVKNIKKKKKKKREKSNHDVTCDGRWHPCTFAGIKVTRAYLQARWCQHEQFLNICLHRGIFRLGCGDLASNCPSSDPTWRLGLVERSQRKRSESRAGRDVDAFGAA